MNESFTKEPLTYKCVDRDFVEWHKGRTRYAVWALEINNDIWLNELVNARSLLDKYLLSGEQRQAHITLFACGFYDESGSAGESGKVINAQLDALRKRKFSPFKIHLSELKSFLTAPYFAIDDKTGALGEIRSILSMYLNEDRSCEYQPHLTVGLYNDCHSTALLSEKMNEYKSVKAPPVLINKLSLMSFSTQSVFSALKTEFQLKLIS